jgi:hypothetical protein
MVVKSSYETVVAPASPDDVDARIAMFSDANAARGHNAIAAPPPTPAARAAPNPALASEETTRSAKARRPTAGGVGGVV